MAEIVMLFLAVAALMVGLMAHLRCSLQEGNIEFHEELRQFQEIQLVEEDTRLAVLIKGLEEKTSYLVEENTKRFSELVDLSTKLKIEFTKVQTHINRLEEINSHCPAAKGKTNKGEKK